MSIGDEGLRRDIGVLGLAANIVNTVVGAGIFVLPALVAARLGPSSMSAYVVCGLLVGAVMLCFAEVGSRIDASGGGYVYIERAFGPFAGFLALNVYMVGASVTSDAAVTNALVDSLASVLPVVGQPWCRPVLIVLLVSGLAWVNVRGVRQGLRIVGFCTAGKLVPLSLIAIAGWTAAQPGFVNLGGIPPADQLGSACILLFFAFQGAETALNVGGELRNPSRTVPRGLALGVTTIFVLYVLIQLVSQAVLGDAIAAYADAPLVEVGRRTLGSTGALILAAGTTISMFGLLSGELMNLPRAAFGGARDGVIPPRVLAAVHPRYATPYVAILVYGAFVVVAALVGEFTKLAILSSASILLFYLGVALSVPRLRRVTNADQPGYRIPGGATIPALTAVSIVWLLSNLGQNEMAWMAGFVAVLSGVFLALRITRRSRLTSRR